MRACILLVLLATGGCKPGTLESGEWGTLRYFGELVGVAPLLDTDDVLQLPLVLIPPVSDRDGNVYVLHQRTTNDSTVYVGQALGGWSQGCPPGEEPLPHTVEGDAHVHGFLGTTESTAWFWAGDALVQVSGETGECKQVLDTDPLTLTNLRVLAAIPMIHETPARRTLNAWVQDVGEAYSRTAPFQIVVDLDLARYVAYDRVGPADATCFDVLGVGADHRANQGVILVGYNLDGERLIEARYIGASGNTQHAVRLQIEGSDFYNCAEDDTLASEPRVLGFLQANSDGVYAGLLDNGRLLAFNKDGGTDQELPDFDAQGIVLSGGDLWVSGVAENRPVVGKLGLDGTVDSVIRFKSSEIAAQGLQGKVKVLDQRFQPSEPGVWDNPASAISRWPFLTPFPMDPFAIETTGWLVAGPSFESTLTRTAVAYGPVGITVP